MIAIRLQRLLVLFLAGVGILWQAWPHPTPAQVSKSPGFVSIQFDSAWVRPSVFSPNGDGRRDSIEIVFTVPGTPGSADTVEVSVYITPAGRTDTTQIIFDRADLLPGVTDRREWNGFDAAGFRQPEGTYTARFYGLSRSGRQYGNRRDFQIDFTAPAPQILQVDPRSYTPTLPGHEAQLPTIRVSITRSELDDQIGVNVLDSLGIWLGGLEPAGGFGGDGIYLFLCDVCADPTIEDGLLSLEVFGRDEAENDTTVVDFLDKNTAGPAVEIAHPQVLSVQRADSLTGWARDRQVVDSLWVSLAPVPVPDSSFAYVPPRRGMPGKTYPFFLDLSTLLVDEGEYPITLRARDTDGVGQDTRLMLRVDRTPPESPRPNPPLPAVARSSTLSGTVVVDGGETEVLVVSGGVGEPDSIDVEERDLVLFTRGLATGVNTLRFEAIDLAGNVSPATTVNVTYDVSAGLFAPERFRLGDRIEVVTGDAAAQGVVVQILAMDGSLVRIFEDASARRLYTFPWDLRTPEGQSVRNGAYLVVARVRRSSGEERLRTMIAVVQ